MAIVRPAFASETCASQARSRRTRLIRQRRAVAILASGVIILGGLFAAGYTGGLRINLTPSYPLGLWRIAPLERDAAVGDLIFICPPATPAFLEAAHRGYVRVGLCTGWLSPLIKTVAARPDQRIKVAGSVAVDGEPLALSNVRLADAEGRALQPYAGGIVPPGHLFLHSEYAGSYDSRYFGPIPADGLLGLAVPVLTVEP